MPQCWLGAATPWWGGRPRLRLNFSLFLLIFSEPTSHEHWTNIWDSNIEKHQLKEHFHYIALTYLIKAYHFCHFENYTAPVRYTLVWALDPEENHDQRASKTQTPSSMTECAGAVHCRQVTEIKTANAQLCTESSAHWHRGLCERDHSFSEAWNMGLWRQGGSDGVTDQGRGNGPVTKCSIYRKPRTWFLHHQGLQEPKPGDLSSLNKHLLQALSTASVLWVSAGSVPAWPQRHLKREQARRIYLATFKEALSLRGCSGWRAISCSCASLDKQSSSSSCQCGYESRVEQLF